MLDFLTSRFDHNHPHHLPRRTLVVATRRTTRKGRNDSSLELYGALAFLLSFSLYQRHLFRADLHPGRPLAASRRFTYTNVSCHPLLPSNVLPLVKTCLLESKLPPGRVQNDSISSSLLRSTVVSSGHHDPLRITTRCASCLQRTRQKSRTEMSASWPQRKR